MGCQTPSPVKAQTTTPSHSHPGSAVPRGPGLLSQRCCAGPRPPHWTPGWGMGQKQTPAGLQLQPWGLQGPGLGAGSVRAGRELAWQSWLWPGSLLCSVSLRPHAGCPAHPALAGHGGARPALPLTKGEDCVICDTCHQGHPTGMRGQAAGCPRAAAPEQGRRSETCFTWGVGAP